jgi:hypothetical protein
MGRRAVGHPMTHAGVVRPTDPHLVTTAPVSPRVEQRDRTRRYLITMSLRLVFFVAAIVLFALDLHWESGVAVAASLILPWVAVVAANAGPRHTIETPSLYAKRTPPAIENKRD